MSKYSLDHIKSQGVGGGGGHPDPYIRGRAPRAPPLDPPLDLWLSDRIFLFAQGQSSTAKERFFAPLFGVYQDCPTPWFSVLVHLFVGFPKQCLSPVGRKSRWRSLRFEWNSQQPRGWPYDWHLGNCSCSELVHYNFHRGLHGGCRE